MSGPSALVPGQPKRDRPKLGEGRYPDDPLLTQSLRVYRFMRFLKSSV